MRAPQGSRHPHFRNMLLQLLHKHNDPVMESGRAPVCCRQTQINASSNANINTTLASLHSATVKNLCIKPTLTVHIWLYLISQKTFHFHPVSSWTIKRSVLNSRFQSFSGQSAHHTPIVLHSFCIVVIFLKQRYDGLKSIKVILLQKLSKSYPNRSTEVLLLHLKISQWYNCCHRKREEKEWKKGEWKEEKENNRKSCNDDIRCDKSLFSSDAMRFHPTG